jgi:HlyD family secretion protein
MHYRLTACTLLAVISMPGIACRGPADTTSIHASGHIEATEVRLAAKVGGRVLEAPLEEGDSVRAGELVARIDTVDAEHRLAAARATVDAADARLRLLLAGSRVEDLRRAEDHLAQAQAELDAANRDLDRLEGLADRGSATEKARDDARTRREVAERAVAAARAELDKLIAGPRREEIEAARAQRAAAAAKVAEINQQILDATVVTPCDGVITERIAEPGEVHPPGATLAILTDIRNPWLNVWIDEPSLSQVALGDRADVRVDGRDETFEATVSFISPVAEFTPKNVQTPEERAKLVFRVKLALDNPNGIFKPGMPADAWFGDHGRGTKQ